MKKFLYILLFISVSNVFSQNCGWSEPKQISSEGNTGYFDYSIDNNNNIHCVYRVFYDWGFRKIYYSKSVDMGETWSEPFDLSQNSWHWADNPKISADSNNNIYVIFSYMIADTIPAQLIFRKYDGESWSEPVDIAKESPNSEYPCITIDNNDKVYAFWHNNFSKIFYRCLEDTTWSPIIQPFEDTYDFYIRKAIPDKNNNIHCVGHSKKNSEDQFSYRPVYFKFDYKNNNWSVNRVLSDSTSLRSIDIDLDSEGRPHIVWSHYVNEMSNPIECSFYSFYNGENWSLSTQLDTADAFHESPAIVLDEYNNTHIIQRKYYHYIYPRYTIHKYYHNLTFCDQIDSVQYMGGGILKHLDSTIILIYAKELEDGLFYPFFRKKSTIPTGFSVINQENSDFRLLRNYPNPFNSSTQIQYSLKANEYINITIYDVNGAKIKGLIDDKRPLGINSVFWDGTNSFGQPVSSGVYFYRIVTAEYSQIRKMLLLK